MKRSTHAWIAIRAIALLEEQNVSPGLVNLLKPFASQASIGAWIPDINEACRSGFLTMNHVFQNLPYNGYNKSRFKCSKSKLVDRLVGCPAIKEYLNQDKLLGSDWWNTPYKAEAKPGQHIPNRIMGLATMLEDLIPLGNDDIACQMGKPCKALADMDKKAKTSPLQLAYYFFMMSHYIADACMPCHCDGRDNVSRTGDGTDLHTGMEKAWEKTLSSEFKDKNLLGMKTKADKLLTKSRDMDLNHSLQFKLTIKKLRDGRDAWLEGVDSCRAFFAMASIIAPYTKYPYDFTKNSKKVLFTEIFPKSKEEEFKKVSGVILHDAVYNTAMIWNHVWQKAST